MVSAKHASARRVCTVLTNALSNLRVPLRSNVAVNADASCAEGHVCVG